MMMLQATGAAEGKGGWGARAARKTTELWQCHSSVAT